MIMVMDAQTLQDILAIAEQDAYYALSAVPDDKERFKTHEIYDSYLRQVYHARTEGKPIHLVIE